MGNPLQLSVGGRTIGKIKFEEFDTALRRGAARRTADGFWLAIPASLTLDWQVDADWQPLVSNLSLRCSPTTIVAWSLGLLGTSTSTSRPIRA